MGWMLGSSLLLSFRNGNLMLGVAGVIVNIPRIDIFWCWITALATINGYKNILIMV